MMRSSMEDDKKDDGKLMEKQVEVRWRTMRSSMEDDKKDDGKMMKKQVEIR
jgi:hypothetical protein